MNIFEKIVIYGFLMINIIALIYVFIVAIKERIARNKVKLSLNKNTSFYPIQNDSFIGTKIYFVPTDADIVRETIIRGCVKNDKGEKFLIIDPSNKKLDFESLKMKDDNHIYTNKSDAEAHLQDLLKGDKE